MQSLQKCGACLRAFVAFDERRRPPAFRTAAFANRLASGKEAALTGAVVGVLYFVGKLAGIFSLLGLAYTAVLAAFTLPKVRIPRKGSFAALFGGLLRRVCGCNVGLGPVARAVAPLMLPLFCGVLHFTWLLLLARASTCACC